jgi:hypothetical protein
MQLENRIPNRHVLIGVGLATLLFIMIGTGILLELMVDFAGRVMPKIFYFIIRWLTPTFAFNVDSIWPVETK